MVPNAAWRNVVYCMKSPLFLIAEMLPTQRKLHAQYSTCGLHLSLSQLVIHFKLILRCLDDGRGITREILDG
jgi:hypothetical protein